MFGKKKHVDSTQEYFEENSDFDPNYNPYGNNYDFQNVEIPQQFEEYHDDIETAYEEVVASRSRKSRKKKKGHKKN